MTPNESVSSRQLSYTIALFLLGSSLIIGISKEAKQDSWISLIISALMSIPILLIYARINTLFPGKSLSTIITEVFGKIFGFIINGLMVFYALYLGSLIIRNFSEYIEVMTMPETPQLAIVLLLGTTVIYMAKSGMKVIGKCSTLFIPLISILILFTIVFSYQSIDITNLMPVMGTGLYNIAIGSVGVLYFPLMEVVVFLYAFGYLKKGESAYKAYFGGLGFAVILLLAVILRNITTLGIPMIQAAYFPSYIAARLINVGNFLTRMEGIISVNLLICGIIKISVCIVAASHGLTEMLRVKDVKSLITPSGLIMMTISTVVYQNISEMFEFFKYYGNFAFPFEIVLPVIIWIGCEIKTRGLRKQNAAVMGTS